METFLEYLQKERGKVNGVIEEYFNKKRKDLTIKDPVTLTSYHAMQNYVLGKGKRLRSICAILGYEACGGKEKQKMYLPSLSVEFFHTASLILDDMMDEDKERRNIKTAHELLGEWFEEEFQKPAYKGYLFSSAKNRFSTSLSVIASNILFSLGNQTILESEFSNEQKNNATEIYQKTYRLVNLGQMLDVYYEYNKKINTEQYLKMAHLKTGVLLGASLKIGGVLANATPKQLEAFDSFGKYAATVFQIQDDIIDVTIGGEKGREAGSDLKKGKTTLLILKAKEKMKKEEWKTIEKVLGNEKATQKELEKAMTLLHETGTVKEVQEMAQKYTQKGKEALKENGFQKEGIQKLEKMADFLLERKK